MTDSPNLDLLVAPDETRRRVAELVERFRRNRDQYRGPGYNETQLRREFLDPFFEALGWDVTNRQGYAEAYKDVIHEAAVDVEGKKKAPDYCFRIGGQRKFYVEAKKPSVNVHDDPGPAYQLRRYGWSAKLTLSILTDFEEFAVYDCRQKPTLTDPAGLARIRFFTCDQYPDHLDELHSLFSREAILRGAFDRFAGDTRRHRGTVEVDSAFLEEIESWRETLARDIERQNRLSVPDLNFAVQATIDRILFLRIAEGRGVEPEGRLREIAERPGLYAALCRLFSEADDKYNAGLFNFSAGGDTLCPGLAISDKTLKPILARLYPPQSPYEFSVIGADILGAVYEQFLGKVIRVTPGGLAKVEEKPEVKKAGGVYYTPTYIVDYIVEHTVGEALAETGTPETAAKLRILDPACGSGSFLLGAYQRLLDWHLQYYLAHDPERHARRRQPPVVRLAENDWRLTISERKRILLNNLYGVDIDRQAVEVTKLNLLLKCLEGVAEQTEGRYLRPGKRNRQMMRLMMHERLLPNIDANIRCGNSLIGSDYSTGRLAIDEEEQRRVNAFDWERGFPEVMKAGGFDCVIGNPPYYKVSGATDAETYAYYAAGFRTASFKIELYALFAERSLCLLRSGGLHSFIVPNSFLAGTYLRPVRCLLAEENTLEDLVLLANVKVFKNAKMDSVVYVCRKSLPAGDSVIALRTADGSLVSSSSEVELVPWQAWAATAGREFRAVKTTLPVSVAERMSAGSTPLGQMCSVHLGLVLASNDLLVDESGPRSHDPILLGRDLSRYGIPTPQKWFAYGRDKMVGGTQRAEVYAAGPRLVFQAIRNLKLPRRLVGTVVQSGTYTMGTVHNIIVRSGGYDYRYILGILSSNLLNEHYAANYPEHRIKGSYLERLPIRTINFSDPSDVARHDRMVALVERMLDLHKRLPEARTPADKDLLQRQIGGTDREIDALVYELYALTEEEIAVVEGEG